jgi:hypothetical protein
MKFGRIGIAALVLAFLVPAFEIESMAIKKVAFYLIIIGVALLTISLQIKINKDLK